MSTVAIEKKESAKAVLSGLCGERTSACVVGRGGGDATGGNTGHLVPTV